MLSDNGWSKLFQTQLNSSHLIYGLSVQYDLMLWNIPSMEITIISTQKTELPFHEVTGEVIGFDEEEHHVTLLLANDTIIKATKNILEQGLDAAEGEWEATLETLLPFEAKFTIQNSEAVSFSMINIQ